MRRHPLITADGDWACGTKCLYRHININGGTAPLLPCACKLIETSRLRRVYHNLDGLWQQTDLTEGLGWVPKDWSCDVYPVCQCDCAIS